MTTSAALLKRLGLAPTPTITGETFTKSSDSSGSDSQSDKSMYPVIFRNVQYNCATDALEAYIRDFEGSKAVINHNGTLATKSGKDLEDLLTSAGRNASLERSMALERLVDESYKKLNLTEACQRSPRAATESDKSHLASQNGMVPHEELPKVSSVSAPGNIHSKQRNSVHSRNVPHVYGYSERMSANKPSNSVSSCNSDPDDGGRPPPSWILDAEQTDSDASSIISGHLMQQRNMNGRPVTRVSTPKQTAASRTQSRLNKSDSSTGPPLNIADLTTTSHSKQIMTTDRILSRSRPLKHDTANRQRSYSAAARVRDQSLHSEQLKSQNAHVNGSSDQLKNVYSPGKGLTDVETDKHKEYLLSLLKDIEQSSSSVVTPFPDLPHAHEDKSCKAANRSVHFWDEQNTDAKPTTALSGSNGDMAEPRTSNGQGELIQSASREVMPEVSSDGFGYLERIQRLIDSSPPSYQAGGPSQDGCSPQQEVLSPERESLSPLTDLTVETDRSWEKLPPLRSPKPLCLGEGDGVMDVKAADDIDQADVTAEQIMDECLSIVSQHDMGDSEVGLTGRTQPGGMEALKNMLFTIQRISQDTDAQVSSNTDTAHNQASVSKPSRGFHGDFTLPSSAALTTTTDHNEHHVPRQSTSASSHSSSSSRSNSQSLDKAMEHLSRLKSLVSSQSNLTPQSSEPSNKT